MSLQDHIKKHEADLQRRVSEYKERKQEGDTCLECKAARVAHISGKCNDLGSFQYGGWECDGYLPHIDNVCGGDYISFDVCLQCGHIQGLFPVDEAELDRVREEMVEEKESDW